MESSNFVQVHTYSRQEGGEQQKQIEKDILDRLTSTYFTTMKTSFVSVVRDQKTDLIPTTMFLDACSSLTTIFDILGSTTFAPVKMDMNGNILKLRRIFDGDSDSFESIQSMVLFEINSQLTNKRNSATDALLWLKRGLEFITEFLRLFADGNPNLTDVGFAAYDKTLKNYHGWVLRGAFMLASKALPYRENFVTTLGLANESIERSKMEKQVIDDCTEYVSALDRILLIINQFYSQYNLDSSKVVG